jgi:hypothetical protein
MRAPCNEDIIVNTSRVDPCRRRRLVAAMCGFRLFAAGRVSINWTGNIGSDGLLTDIRQGHSEQRCEPPVTLFADGVTVSLATYVVDFRERPGRCRVCRSVAG